MIIFVKLILAHLIGDFVLQSKRWVEEKEKRGAHSFKLYLHGLVHGALVWLFLWDIRSWAPALAIAAVHILIDLTMI